MKFLPLLIPFYINFTCSGFLKYPKLVYILLHSDSQECSIFQSDDDHQHASHFSRISTDVKEFVNACMRDGFNSNKIIMEKITFHK